MENSHESRSKRNHKARERQEKRRQRSEVVSNIASEALPKLPPVKVPNNLQVLWAVVIDNLWQMREQGLLASLSKISAALLVIILFFFALGIIFSPNIGPNIRTLGLDMGGKSIEDATAALFNYWNEELLITIRIGDESFAQVHPSEIGLHLDATATAQAAKEAGLSGIPFGYELEPIINAQYSEAQAYILALASDIFIPSYEAGYEWRDGSLVSVAGRPSRELDITASVQRIVDVPLLTVENRYVELVTNSTPPLALDADPYYEAALAFVTSDFTIEAYDPFRDETQFWASTPEQMASWLVATDNGLSIREEGLEGFISYVNTQILNDESRPRYLDLVETYEAINTALQTGADTALLRVRYQDTVYVLQDGDWGQRLSRRTGLPFFNISQVNPGVDWNRTLIGDRINLPSRDLVMPLPPVPTKRIIVDLERMWLVAYENGEMVFNWPISIGRTDAPTNPGIFQILDKSEVAYGSGFSLCNENSECGQWEMAYFMSIYEISTGFTNGFHGRVLLPNGAYLDQGSFQAANTFGCIMSDNREAEILYNWADIGVVVEIISDEFPPESQTAIEAMNFISTQS